MPRGLLRVMLLGTALVAACSHDWDGVAPQPLDDCTVPALPDPRARVVYVAPDGADTREGTRDQPVRTLENRYVCLIGWPIEGAWPQWLEVLCTGDTARPMRGAIEALR